MIIRLFDYGHKIGVAWERDGKRQSRKFRNPLWPLINWRCKRRLRKAARLAILEWNQRVERPAREIIAEQWTRI